MTRWDLIREQEKKSRKTLKTCTMAKRYKVSGFKEPVINGRGQCSGCRNPDDGELEPQCDTCSCNEYYTEEVRA